MDGESQVQQVRVFFGVESYVVEVEVDPSNPLNEDALIDRARDTAKEQYNPEASFRKGTVLESV